MCRLSLLLTVLLAPASGWTANLFVEAGYPSTDQAWSSGEFLQAANLTTASRSENLPALRDPDGAAVFRRLVAKENLAEIEDHQATLDDRLASYQTFTNGFGILFARYASASVNGEPLHAEQAHLNVLSMRIRVAGLRLVDEIMAASPRDESHRQRLTARAGVQHGMQLSFLAAVLSLSDQKTYAAEDLAVTLAGLRELVPAAVDLFTKDFRNELQVRLGMRRGQTKDAAEQEALNEVIAILSNYQPRAN